MSRTPHEELTEFISDLYSLEKQALAQLESAPDSAGDHTFAEDLKTHYVETETQVAALEDRLTELGISQNRFKDALMELGGKGFLAFAKTMPETPGRLLAHSYAFEALEIASYDMLTLMAEEIGDTRTRDLSRLIRAEEERMKERLEEHFASVVAVSHRDLDASDFSDDIAKHLAEAHAIEKEATELFEKGLSVCDEPESRIFFAEEKENASDLATKIDTILQWKGHSSSFVMDMAMKLGGLNWALFFKSQADAPAKYAVFSYAMLHLQIAAYELLARTAKLGDDETTLELCRTALRAKRSSSEKLLNTFPAALRETLNVLAS